MKNPIKFLTAIILLTACFTSSAQISILINDIKPLLAIHSDIQNGIVISSEYTITGTSFYAEEKLELEDWMLARENWMNEPLSRELNSKPASSTENALLLEDWMLGPVLPQETLTSNILREETEPALELKEWMLNKDFWTMKD